MKVSMKQARRIEREIGAQIEIDTHGRAGLGGQLNVSIYEDMRTKLDEVQAETLQDVKKMSELIRVRFAIRKAIETQNEVAGINALMNHEAALKAVAKVLMTTMTGELDDSERNIAIQRHSALKQQHEAGTAPQNRYGGDNDVITLGKVLTTSTIEQLRAIATDTQRELLGIVDKLAALNATSQIEIPDADLKVLEAANIIV